MHHAPFAGTADEAAREYMVRVAADPNAASVACLAGTRIVDALLEAAARYPFQRRTPARTSAAGCETAASRSR